VETYVTRDHIVSIRLTDAERARLLRLGRPTDVIRRLITEAFSLPLPRGESVGYTPPKVIWYDGTTGGMWPEAVTR
jgi:hypothetical protein